jgi:hypothetical protein
VCIRKVGVEVQKSVFDDAYLQMNGIDLTSQVFEVGHVLGRVVLKPAVLRTHPR